MLVDKQSTRKEITYEYIRGLTDGKGCFTFYPSNSVNKYGEVTLRKIPAYVLRMHIRDEKLITDVRDKLKLNAKINICKAWKGDGVNRGDQAALIVRRIGDIKNTIVPLFANKLIGYKGKQFEDWMEKIGSDQSVGKKYKVIHMLYKRGYYDKNNKFSD